MPSTRAISRAKTCAGLNVGLLVDIPGRMGEGNWKVAAYVDERASGKAYNGILQIFSGAAGGTTGLFTMLVSEIIGAEREKVEIVREGNKRGINIGRKIQGEIEMIAGLSPDHPVMVSNSKYWMGPDIIAATGAEKPRCATMAGSGTLAASRPRSARSTGRAPSLMIDRDYCIDDGAL